MSNKLKLSILTLFISFFGVNAQNKSVSVINSFIKENSSSHRNYWARISLENDNLLIYNTSRNNVGKYSFPINKIEANSIKTSKKKVIIKSNTNGEYVSYWFGVERKESVAVLLIYKMDKVNRLKLTELLSSLIKDIQNNKN
ncbi:MAG TPA: hypothetical protein EYP87_01280 [Flavobacteriaceae bacterium]|nr:hypothetical protein [Flavobacteriaceae bacterium]